VSADRDNLVPKVGRGTVTVAVTSQDGYPQRPEDKAGTDAPSRALDSPSHAPRLLSVKEAAAYLSVSPWTIRSLGWNGEIPEVKIGRRVLYDRLDLDRFIERSKRRQG